MHRSTKANLCLTVLVVINSFLGGTLLQGTVCFVLGLFLIFVRWPIIGIILETYGCIVLFGWDHLFLVSYRFLHTTTFTWSKLTSHVFIICSGFWSTVKMFLSQIPFVGWMIQYPLMVSNPRQYFPCLLPFAFRTNIQSLGYCLKFIACVPLWLAKLASLGNR